MWPYRTFEEAERRTRQIEQLQSKDIQLQKLYDPRTNDYVLSRNNLLRSSSSAFTDGGTISWAVDDDDKPLAASAQVPVTDLLGHREQVLRGNNSSRNTRGIICYMRYSLYSIFFFCFCRARQRFRWVM